MWYLIHRPFAFAGIQHPVLRPFLFRAPIFAAILLTGLFWLLPVKPPLAGDGSLSRHMITAFGIMPGFYIAALAAVATFARSELDEVMPTPPPKLVLRTGGRDETVELTFRMFIASLFAYLTSLSFFAVFLFIGADLSAASAKHVIGQIVNEGARELVFASSQMAYVALVTWLAAKIVFTTLIGMYFLAERMHRPSA